MQKDKIKYYLSLSYEIVVKKDTDCDGNVYLKFGLLSYVCLSSFD